MRMNRTSHSKAAIAAHTVAALCYGYIIGNDALSTRIALHRSEKERTLHPSIHSTISNLSKTHGTERKKNLSIEFQLKDMYEHEKLHRTSFVIFRRKKIGFDHLRISFFLSFLS